MFLDSFDVALLFMVYVELDQASELQRVGEEEDDPVESAHCRVEEFQETRQALFSVNSVVRFVPHIT